MNLEEFYPVPTCPEEAQRDADIRKMMKDAAIAPLGNAYLW